MPGSRPSILGALTPGMASVKLALSTSLVPYCPLSHPSSVRLCLEEAESEAAVTPPRTPRGWCQGLRCLNCHRRASVLWVIWSTSPASTPPPIPPPLKRGLGFSCTETFLGGAAGVGKFSLCLAHLGPGWRAALPLSEPLIAPNPSSWYRQDLSLHLEAS